LIKAKGEAVPVHIAKRYAKTAYGGVSVYIERLSKPQSLVRPEGIKKLKIKKTKKN
jgi:hypothetical protein